MGDGLNHVDLCFVVDTTGSMQPFISAAQAALLDTVCSSTARCSNHLGSWRVSTPERLASA